jgi:heme/copper-type cytochrome/quinol oxidase subunit 4
LRVNRHFGGACRLHLQASKKPAWKQVQVLHTVFTVCILLCIYVWYDYVAVSATNSK